MKDALDFYKICLLPTYRDWINDPMQEHKIRHVIGTLNDMAEWIYKTIPQEKAKVASECEYRDYIAQIVAVYSPIRDVADGKKHLSLNRNTRQITHVDQVNEKTYTDVDAVPDTDALTDWDDLHEWGVTHDDGRWTALAPAIEQLKAFWEDKLRMAGFRL